MSKLQNERLKKYIEAEEAILAGQSYTIGNRTLTRANLATVEKVIQDLIDGGAVLEDDDSARNASTKRVVLLD
ncbi:DUF6148 family protein [Dialister hominis]|jgi:hypothetical protein|uniref:DUF6148 family protein n=1 Tax=Dialister hominis TaxID=2582419 RepID=UPI00204F5CCA|nr:DUF6148 family protein [uncultured Dialister sp.]DAP87049.1 MAG TPA: head to tail adaptor [Caudoviricetes sp.]